MGGKVDFQRKKVPGRSSFPALTKEEEGSPSFFSPDLKKREGGKKRALYLGEGDHGSFSPPRWVAKGKGGGGESSIRCEGGWTGGKVSQKKRPLISS